MTRDRRWLWAGGILAVAGGALALGVPLATLITIAAVLACPTAMYFGMGMMGRTWAGAETVGGASALDNRDGAAAGPAVTASPFATGALVPERAAPSEHEDPIVILERRLAAGEVTVEEYKRLLATLSRPDPWRGAVASRPTV